MFNLALIINPYAGIGGRVGLKGSDGESIKKQAVALGGIKLAETKARNCFLQFLPHYSKISVSTVSGEMGENLCCELGLNYQVVYQANKLSSGSDTCKAVEAMKSLNIDLILFVGGDGTARNIFEVASEHQTFLGVPAGVKIHSGVYATSAKAAGLLILELLMGKMLNLISADVVDIDESAFRQGQLKSRYYGSLQIPSCLQYVQAVKNGHQGQDSEELVTEDIAADVIESMEDDQYYVIGSGSTCEKIMLQLGLKNTLLGLDIIFQEQLIASDVTEKELLKIINNKKKLQIIITVIGGQGHVLGRGNHQISPQVITQVGWNNFHIIASQAKLTALNDRPLLVDTGDLECDQQLQGLKKVITGYHHYVLYPVGL